MASIEIIDAAGNSRIIESINNLSKNTRRGIDLSLFKIGKDLQKTFNEQVLSKNKTGRIYKIRRNGVSKNHQSSAAGESPANISGFYRKSIGYNVSSSELRFGNSAEYAGYLELGTSRMKARPGLGNAVKVNERNILRDLTDGILESI